MLAEEAKRPYRLLDRDRRFRFLGGFQEFSLTEPFLVDEPYDAVFLDPPFANVRRCFASGTLSAGSSE